MNKKYVTKSPEETQGIAKGFAKQLQCGDVVALYGDLGNGKTTFVQGLAEGLGIKRRILSPTFVIMRTYHIRDKSQDLRVKNPFKKSEIPVIARRNDEAISSIMGLPRPAFGGARNDKKKKSDTSQTGFKNFYHVDLYRIEDEKDVQSLGIMELMKDPNNIMVIEWAEKMKSLLPSKRLELFFSYINEQERQIKIIKKNN